MLLVDLPLALALVGLALYTVLAGADFGAGFWQLAAGRGPHAVRVRDAGHESMGPVWEANHVWLIYVLTVVWTAYPRAFGSIASTLAFPLFAAAIGIIMRGASYALRSGTASRREQRTVETAFAISSVLTPLALGAAVGGIASRRVPVGNAAGDLVTSWLNPTSALVGALAVAACAYLAAVYLAADSRRRAEPGLESWFRARALVAGVAAGGLAIGGLAVLRSDAHPLYHELVAGSGLAALVVSAAAGVGALAATWWRRFEVARYAAALAVAAIIAGWALAQYPLFLPGMSVRQAAAPHDVLVAVTVAVVAGGLLLFPSLALLFGLLLRGRFEQTAPAASLPVRGLLSAARAGLLGRAAAASGIAGLGLTGVADAGWAHGVGVALLFAFVALGVLAVRPWALADEDAAQPS